MNYRYYRLAEWNTTGDLTEAITLDRNHINLVKSRRKEFLEKWGDTKILVSNQLGVETVEALVDPETMDPPRPFDSKNWTRRKKFPGWVFPRRQTKEELAFIANPGYVIFTNAVFKVLKDSFPDDAKRLGLQTLFHPRLRYLMRIVFDGKSTIHALTVWDLGERGVYFCLPDPGLELESIPGCVEVRVKEVHDQIDGYNQENSHGSD